MGPIARCIGMTARTLLFLGLVSAGFACPAWPASSRAACDERFADEVAPVLVRRCLACHGGAKTKGGLSLANAERAALGGDSGPVIVPGAPDESLLVELIEGPEPEMPARGEPLSDAEVRAVREWIVRGATWPEGLVLEGRTEDVGPWWSFEPMAEVAVPAVPPEQRDRARNELDAFVLAALRTRGLEPSREADRRTLLRRLAFDLTGLPPTLDELDAFLADPGPDAYEREVERLLASPHYGERWGRHWLDVVHYADTHGYDKDKRRPNAWPYRDWVIRALNDDMPYAQFVAMQLAGDVLDPLDADGIIATGFLVAGPWDFVGHVELREGTLDKQIARNLDRDDMVTTVMTTFTSLTAHCARCHDHKFDPITQADYYGLQAVFAGIERADRDYDVDREVAEGRAVLLARERELEADEARLRVRVGAPEVRTHGYHSAIEASADVTKWVQVDLGRSATIDAVQIMGAHVAFGGHPGPGFGFVPRFRVEAADDAEFLAGVTVLVDHTADDFPNPGDEPYTVALASPVTARHVRVTATRLWERTDDFVFALGELAVFSDGENVAFERPVTALDSIEAGASWGKRHLVDGMFAETSFAERAALADEALRGAFDRASERLAAVRAELAALPAASRVYAAAKDFTPDGSFTPPLGGMPRPIHLLARGSERAPGALVGPAAIAAVMGPRAFFDALDPADEGARRLALARWIVDPANPLTWRSIVNRVWHHHFGRGLVATPSDFGHMGELPTHPALLDWLARRFRDEGQSLKDLHRLIVTSATYRQTSADRPECAAVDGENRFLWRMNRRRLDAESVRDAILAASGELDVRMGGPGFDLFVFEDDHSPRYLYDQHDPDEPEGLRRSVYRFVVRSVPDPFMEVFDCADPSINVPVRFETTTALQALSLLNDPFVLRRAERFAERVAVAADSPAGRVRAVWRLALGRAPSEAELAAGVEEAERRGLPSLCRVLFNTSEFVFVD